MKQVSLSFTVAAAVLSMVFLSGCTRSGKSVNTEVRVEVSGELGQRLMKNFDRLEEERYRPDNVFLTEEQSGDWPGDNEGRTLLALVMDAKATGRTPKYLDEILNRLPSHLNERGYMGTIHEGYMHEQQISGNGWLLRGLCEYYLWSGDKKVLETVKSVSHNLFCAGKGYYSNYPIDPQKRAAGEGGAAGNISTVAGGWALSTDIGCVFIGLDGLTQAYEVTRDPDLIPVIDEMIDRFLQMDLVGIRAQTHATLTACRAIMRWCRITGNSDLAMQVAVRFDLYKNCGMNEIYENINWFDRPDTWSEPCAIVDSYILACELWEWNHDQSYLDYAELIYYNAICHSQRANGGFGCDNCPGLSSGTNDLMVKTPEAYWCCTMRGAEGLARAASSSWTAQGDIVTATQFRDSRMVASRGEKELIIRETGDYPFSSSMTFAVEKNTLSKNVTIRIPVRYWMKKVKVEGGPEGSGISDGFLVLKGDFPKGTTFTVNFTQIDRESSPINPRNVPKGSYRHMRGPLILDIEGNPVYHLMDPAVTEDEGYHRTILLQ